MRELKGLRINLVRNGNAIDFVNEHGAMIATLIDGDDAIIYDAMSCTDYMLAGITNEELVSAFAEIGMTVEAAREIDAMPAPMRQSWEGKTMEIKMTGLQGWRHDGAGRYPRQTRYSTDSEELARAMAADPGHVTPLCNWSVEGYANVFPSRPEAERFVYRQF